MKKILVFAFILFLSLPVQSTFAFSSGIGDKLVYGHKSPNGSVSFLGQATKAGAIPGNYSKLFLVKVNPVESDYYYYFYVEVKAAAIRKNPISKVIVEINNKAVTIEPLEGFPNIYEDKTFGTYFKIPSTKELEEAIGSMTSLKLILMSGDKVIKDDSMRESAQSSFKELLKVKKTDYIGEGLIGSNLKDYEKTTYHPVIFIPNVSKEAVLKALLVETSTFVEKDGAYKFKRFVNKWNYKNDEHGSLVFQGEYYDSFSPHITITNQQYKNGIWIDVNLKTLIFLQYRDKKGIYSSTLDEIDYIEKRESFNYFVNSKIDGNYFWAKTILNVYYNLHGQYDYGITWDFVNDKQTKENSFILKSVNVDKFAALSAFSVGDKIISINGHLTKYMKPVALDYMLTANGQKATITAIAADNSEKTVTIEPVFVANPNPKDYGKLYSLIPIKSIKPTGTQYKYYYYYFHPIEKDLFGW